MFSVESNYRLSKRPQTGGVVTNSHSMLPVRILSARIPSKPMISRKFRLPYEHIVKQVTHEHILDVGDQILTHIKRDTDIQIKQTYEKLIQAERSRLEEEYQLKTNQLNLKWKEQLETEKHTLQEEFNNLLTNIDQKRHETNREKEKELIRRMKDESEAALARQWQLANERLSKAVEDTERRTQRLMELQFIQEKQNVIDETVAKMEIEYSQRERIALQTLKQELEEKHQLQIREIDESHKKQIDEWKTKNKLTEKKFHQEFNDRVRLESDFRLLQTDYKRFMDYTNFFHSDYLLKLHHVGQQLTSKKICDTKFEQILDRILNELNQTSSTTLPSNYSRSSSLKVSKCSLNIRDN